MKRIAIACLLVAACATMHSTFKTAHEGSLTALASKDFSCPREQVTATETSENLWTAQGCGRSATYRLLNSNCLVERDCAWEQQDSPPPPPR